ncbi:hypothetical protein BH20ACT14_BH20ACT14_06330 [soil metagenome]
MGAAWGSLVSGAASVAALPVAVYLTRFSERYELLHAGFAIPLAAILGVAAITLARRARRRNALLLDRDSSSGLARAGGVLGIVGVCMALAALVALGVYALLEYVGSRE